MAAPVDADRQFTIISTAGTTHNISFPASSAGELLIVFVRFAAAPGTVTWAGYTGLAVDTSDASDDESRWYWHLADGTEGTTETFTTANSVKLAAIVWRVTGAADPTVTPPELSARTISTGANVDPGSITPTGGPKDFLYITTLGMDTETATATVEGTYSNQVASNSGTGGAAASNCRIWGASKGTSATSSENPAAWTSSAPVSGATAATIAIHPAAAAAPSLVLPNRIKTPIRRRPLTRLRR